LPKEKKTLRFLQAKEHHIKGMIVQHEDATNKRRNPKRKLVESYDNNHGSKSVFFFFFDKNGRKTMNSAGSK
jgi:hypothetical protein